MGRVGKKKRHHDADADADADADGYDWLMSLTQSPTATLFQADKPIWIYFLPTLQSTIFPFFDYLLSSVYTTHNPILTVNPKPNVCINIMQRLTVFAIALLGTLAHALAPQKSIFSRRQALSSAAAFGVGSLVWKQEASAAGAPPTKEELDRLRKGYEQIQYLLNNFEQETTICKENGGECKRDADAIRRVLGLRSTTDPLFQIDKVFNKVKNMDIDPDQLDAFFEATEDWNSAMNMSNSMAFISQFGEYNVSVLFFSNFFRPFRAFALAIQGIYGIRGNNLF